MESNIYNLDKNYLAKINNYVIKNIDKPVESLINKDFNCNLLTAGIANEENYTEIVSETNQFNAINYNQNKKENKKGVGIINIKGVIDYSSSIWQMIFGGSSIEQIKELITEFANSNDVSSIILRIQSPGGVAIGSSELSELIYNLRSQKNIIAFADPYAFSAAYQIGSAANKFYTIKTGQVGSIGTYTIHTDYSEAIKNDGVKVTFIYAGDKKIDGNPYQPLSDSAKADIQGEVDELYNIFVADVARNRATTVDNVLANYGQGMKFLASGALSRGLIDGITNFDELVSVELSALVNNGLQAKNEALAKQKQYIENNKRFLEMEFLK